MPTPEAILEAHEVTYRYPGAETPALDRVSLVVRRGEFVLLTGPSGCGKSTLLRCFLGLVPHLHGGDLDGRVTALGQDVATTLPHRLAPRVGMVFQNPEDQLVATTVEADVAFGPENLGLPRAEVVERVEDTFARAGIADLRKRSVHEISAGQQQRVALAAILALRPEVLLLDEPTSQLDPRSARELLAWICGLNREAGLTVVLAEHRLEMALPQADRMLVMAGGRVVRDGPIRVVVAQDGLAGLGVGVPRIVDLCQSVPLAGDLPLSVAEAGERVLAQMALTRADSSTEPAVPRSRESATDVSTSRPALSAQAETRFGGEVRRPPLVSVRALRYAYPDGQEALCGIDLAIFPGEVLALLGESGAGKTTLAKHLNGLLRATSGQVLVAGLDAASTSVARLAATVGYVFQNPLHQLFAETVEEELSLGPRAQGWPRQAILERTEELLVSFGLARYRRRHPLALSEGERRRVALAATLAARPRVVVLDEPTVGQDQGEKSRLGGVIRRLRGDNCAVLVITHDVEFAADHCPRFVVMAQGRIVADGPGREVLARLDALSTAALEPPQVVQLGRLLAHSGFNAEAQTVEDARRELERLLRRA